MSRIDVAFGLIIGHGGEDDAEVGQHEPSERIDHAVELLKRIQGKLKCDTLVAVYLRAAIVQDHVEALRIGIRFVEDYRHPFAEFPHTGDVAAFKKVDARGAYVADIGAEIFKQFTVGLGERFRVTGRIFEAYLSDIAHTVVDIKPAVVGQMQPCRRFDIGGAVDGGDTLVLRLLLVFQLILHPLDLLDALFKGGIIGGVVSFAYIVEGITYELKKLPVVDEQIFHEEDIGFIGVDGILDGLANDGGLVVDIIAAFMFQLLKAKGIIAQQLEIEQQSDSQNGYDRKDYNKPEFHDKSCCLIIEEFMEFSDAK